MNKCSVVSILVMFLMFVELSSLSQAIAVEEGRHDTAANEIRLLNLSGSPYERGVAHGRALKSEIKEMVAAFKNELEVSYNVDSATFIKRFIDATDFTPTVDKWTPGLLDEVRGIAAGSGVPFDEIYVYQLTDEYWSMGRWAVKHKCTSIGVSRRGDQSTIVAQNMDLPRFLRKYPTLLRIRYNDGPDQMVLTCPGLIGINGMNSSGLAVCCNTLSQLRPSEKGVPFVFVVRGMLEHGSLRDAESWLTTIPHAVGQNYTLGDASIAVAWECSATSKMRFQPDNGSNYTYHTNHPLVNTDWHPDFILKCEKDQRAPRDGLGVCYRFEALRQRFESDSSFTQETIIDALASKDFKKGPICGDWNYACTVFVLGETPALHISAGRPDRNRMQTFSFD